MVPMRSLSMVSSNPKRVDLPVRFPPARPTGRGDPASLVPPLIPVGAEAFAGAGGAKEGTVLGVERARMSVL